MGLSDETQTALDLAQILLDLAAQRRGESSSDRIDMSNIEFGYVLVALTKALCYALSDLGDINKDK